VADRARHPSDYQFSSEQVNDCPYPFYDAARERCPVYELPGGVGYLLTRYSDVSTAVGNTSVFSSHRPVLGAGDPEFEAIAAQGYPQVATLVTNDPPEHGRIKRLVTKGFTPRSVKALEAEVYEIVDELIDRFIGDGSVELMAQFAQPLPTRVIGNAFGVPVADHGRFQGWADDIADSVSTYISRERALECKRGIVEMQHYFATLIEQRRGEPGPDLVSELVAARVGGERPLDVPEILEVIRIFVAGGVESTASLIGSAMFLLLKHPEQLRQVREDHGLIPRMLEEALRAESPVQWNPRMIEREPTAIAATELPVASRVLLGWGPANRDPDVFGPDADRFDIHRDSRNHLAFGKGVHFCIGAALARAEARIAFERLLTRLPEIELAVPVPDIRYQGAFVRRVSRLPLRFTAAQDGAQ
jgi:cytochrome P450